MPPCPVWRTHASSASSTSVWQHRILSNYSDLKSNLLMTVYCCVSCAEMNMQGWCLLLMSSCFPWLLKAEVRAPQIVDMKNNLAESVKNEITKQKQWCDLFSSWCNFGDRSFCAAHVANSQMQTGPLTSVRLLSSTFCFTTLTFLLVFHAEVIWPSHVGLNL